MTYAVAANQHHSLIIGNPRQNNNWDDFQRCLRQSTVNHYQATLSKDASITHVESIRQQNQLHLGKVIQQAKTSHRPWSESEWILPFPVEAVRHDALENAQSGRESVVLWLLDQVSRNEGPTLWWWLTYQRHYCQHQSLSVFDRAHVNIVIGL